MVTATNTALSYSEILASKTGRNTKRERPNNYPAAHRKKYQDIGDDPEDDSLERAKGKLSEEAYQQVKEAKEQAKGLPEQYLQELAEIMALQNNETAEQVLLD